MLNELCADTPAVLVARSLPGWEDRTIGIDNVHAGYLATKFLIDLGHTEIVHLTGIKDHQDAIARLKGYRKALKESGIAINEDRIVECNFNSQSGVLAIQSLLARGISYSAIFAANDEMAIGARLGLYRRGIRVPDDVSLVGFDNQPVSAFLTPPLTTVGQPAHEMGSAAVKMMFHLLKNEPYEIPDFPVDIVVRESVVPRR